jgi:hypothetical protein
VGAQSVVLHLLFVHFRNRNKKNSLDVLSYFNSNSPHLASSSNFNFIRHYRECYSIRLEWFALNLTRSSSKRILKPLKWDINLLGSTVKTILVLYRFSQDL